MQDGVRAEVQDGVPGPLSHRERRPVQHCQGGAMSGGDLALILIFIKRHFFKVDEQQCSEKLEEVCGEIELAECREEQVTFSTEEQDI